uniref:Uncharacterized protein n=1 Tax=Cucumis sativus TaxID=3659 RepID=A0A0A0KQD8_CUCSA
MPRVRLLNRLAEIGGYDENTDSVRFCSPENKMVAHCLIVLIHVAISLSIDSQFIFWISSMLCFSNPSFSKASSIMFLLATMYTWQHSDSYPPEIIRLAILFK